MFYLNWPKVVQVLVHSKVRIAHHTPTKYLHLLSIMICIGNHSDHFKAQEHLRIPENVMLFVLSLEHGGMRLCDHYFWDFITVVKGS